MDFDQIKTFYYVSKFKSLSKAAEHLCISQPAASRRLQLLEHFFKRRLVMRSPGPGELALSREGELFLQHITPVMIKMESLKDIVFEEEKTVKGKLKIATTHGIASGWLITCLAGFLKQYPDLRVEITANDNEVDLFAREADIAIRPFMYNQPLLIQEHLMTLNTHLYASQSYLDEYGLPQTVDDLDHHRLIVFGDPGDYPFSSIEWPLTVGRTKEQGARRPYLIVNNAEAMVEAALNGLGIVGLSLNRMSAREKLIRVLEEHESGPSKTYIIFHSHVAQIKSIQALFIYIKEYWGDVLY